MRGRDIGKSSLDSTKLPVAIQTKILMAHTVVPLPAEDNASFPVTPRTRSVMPRNPLPASSISVGPRSRTLVGDLRRLRLQGNTGMPVCYRESAMADLPGLPSFASSARSRRAARSIRLAFAMASGAYIQYRMEFSPDRPVISLRNPEEATCWTEFVY